MARILADADALEALGQALAQTKQELELLGIRMRGYEVAVGSDRVRRGVDRLVSNWSDVREKMTAELESVSALVRAAACEYQALEQQIVAAMAEEPPPASGTAAGG